MSLKRHLSMHVSDMVSNLKGCGGFCPRFLKPFLKFFHHLSLLASCCKLHKNLTRLNLRYTYTYTCIVFLSTVSLISFALRWGNFCLFITFGRLLSCMCGTRPFSTIFMRHRLLSTIISLSFTLFGGVILQTCLLLLESMHTNNSSYEVL